MDTSTASHYNPKTCNANFQSMKPAEAGRRHCGSCQRQVANFTNMTWEEIRQYREENPLVCGAFSKQQLAHWGKSPNPKPRRSLAPAALAVSLTVGAIPTAAQHSTAVYDTIQTDQRNDDGPIMAVEERAAPKGHRTVYGRVLLDNDHQVCEPLPFAMVFAPGFEDSAVAADFDGYFTIELGPEIQTDSLQVSYLGIMNAAIRVADTSKPATLYVRQQRFLAGASFVSVGVVTRIRESRLSKIRRLSSYVVPSVSQWLTACGRVYWKVQRLRSQRMDRE